MSWLQIVLSVVGQMPNLVSSVASIVNTVRGQSKDLQAQAQSLLSSAIATGDEGVTRNAINAVHALQGYVQLPGPVQAPVIPAQPVITQPVIPHLPYPGYVYPHYPVGMPVQVAPHVEVPHVLVPRVDMPHVVVPRVEVPHVMVPHVEVPHVVLPRVEVRPAEPLLKVKPEVVKLK